MLLRQVSTELRFMGLMVTCPISFCMMGAISGQINTVAALKTGAALFWKLSKHAAQPSVRKG